MLKPDRPLWSYGTAEKQIRVGQPKEKVIVIRVVQPVELELIVTRRDLRHMAVFMGFGDGSGFMGL